jgi:hypothetical protein
MYSMITSHIARVACFITILELRSFKFTLGFDNFCTFLWCSHHNVTGRSSHYFPRQNNGNSERRLNDLLMRSIQYAFRVQFLDRNASTTSREHKHLYPSGRQLRSHRFVAVHHSPRETHIHATSTRWLQKQCAEYRGKGRCFTC